MQFVISYSQGTQITPQAPKDDTLQTCYQIAKIMDVRIHTLKNVLQPFVGKLVKILKKVFSHDDC